MLTVKKQRREDGKQGLLGGKDLGWSLQGNAGVGESPELLQPYWASCSISGCWEPCMATKTPSLSRPAAGPAARRQWWGWGAHVPSAPSEPHESSPVLQPPAWLLTRRCHAAPTPAIPCQQPLRRLGKLHFLLGTPPPGTSIAAEQNCFQKP